MTGITGDTRHFLEGAFPRCGGANTNLLKTMDYPKQRRHVIDRGILRRLVEIFRDTHNLKNPDDPIDYEKAHRTLRWKGERSVEEKAQEKMQPQTIDPDERGDMPGDEDAEKSGGWRR